MTKSVILAFGAKPEGDDDESSEDDSGSDEGTAAAGRALAKAIASGDGAKIASAFKALSTLCDDDAEE